ncbi:hypothetical protein V865_008490 [Kwoniella europaea PYCC6329]|uniref:Uncharacterized protein n=1 Tax=Kwoniella europaea PYCC6329 TaxID=1423913 RepID=A0AAX4KV96_9TREE
MCSVLGTGCARTAYHQQDLTVVLRLNRNFFDIAGKILYANPIVDDPFQFFYGLSHSPSSDYTSRNPYYDLNEQERKEWESDLSSKSSVDLENCAKCVDLLNQPVVQECLKGIWTEGTDCLRIGGYDGGWWADKLSQIKHIQQNQLNDFSRIHVYELSGVLYYQIMDE